MFEKVNLVHKKIQPITAKEILNNLDFSEIENL